MTSTTPAALVIEGAPRTAIAIYNQSRFIGWVYNWKQAVRVVKELARYDGISSRSWYRTANRDGFADGNYRATQLFAKKA